MRHGGHLGWPDGEADEHTLLLLDLALISFSRKFSQSLSAEASSTTISRLSSESLKTMYLYFLLSFRSLKAVTHSCDTEALRRGKGQYAFCSGRSPPPPPSSLSLSSSSLPVAAVNLRGGGERGDLEAASRWGDGGCD